MSNKKFNYLRFIIIILITLSVFFIISNIYILSGSKIAGADQVQISIDLRPENNIISKNLISYVKKEIATTPQITESTPLLGNPNAPITIFEFASFKCPHSKQVQPVIKQILKKYPDKVRLAWKDLPLTNAYQDAMLTHQSARCAGEQSAFWAYHDLLWQQDNISQDDLIKMADDLGLNQNEFEKCLSNNEITQTINQDIVEADSLLIPGVPHFYINSQELMGKVNLDDFIKVIEAELSR